MACVVFEADGFLQIPGPHQLQVPRMHHHVSQTSQNPLAVVYHRALKQLMGVLLIFQR